MKYHPVTRPKHYNSHPSGIECIEISQHYGFCVGNAIKYIWRAGLKGSAVEDLKKARWYLDREIMNREGQVSSLAKAKKKGFPPKKGKPC